MLTFVTVSLLILTTIVGIYQYMFHIEYHQKIRRMKKELNELNEYNLRAVGSVNHTEDKLKHYEHMCRMYSDENARLKSVIRVQAMPRFEHLGENHCMYEMPDGREIHMTKVPSYDNRNTLYRLSLNGRGDVLFTLDEMHAIDHLARYTMNRIDVIAQVLAEAHNGNNT
jgi:hypothetical protein